MAALHVQSKSAHVVATGTSIAATFDAAVGSGGLVCGTVMWGTTVDEVTSITDNQSNTYTHQRLITDTPNGVSSKSFYLGNITNGPVTVTVNFNTSVVDRNITIHEASGIVTASPLDQETGQFQSAPGTGTDAVTSGAVTTTESGEYIFGGVNGATGGGGTYTAGTGYTIRENNAEVLASESRIQAAAGSIAATFTQSADHNVLTHIMTFKAAAGVVGDTVRSVLAMRVPNLV